MTDQNNNPATPETNPESLFSNTDGGSVQPEDKTLSLDQEQLKAILKQNSNAQSHINTLEGENKTLRTQLEELQRELSNSASFQDLLAGLENQGASTTVVEPKTPSVDTDQLTSQIKDAVLGELTQAQQMAIEQQNINEALKLAKEKFGDKYEEQLVTIGENLGMDMSDIDNVARRSPKAFAQLIGGTVNSGGPAPTTTSLSSPPNTHNNAPYDFAKIAKLKREVTPEGMEANRLWQSAEFQQAYRKWIMKDVS